MPRKGGKPTVAVFDTNMGSKQGRVPFPCRVCTNNCGYDQEGIHCDGCEAWMHIQCIDMAYGTYATYSITGHYKFFVVTVYLPPQGLLIMLR